MTRGRKPLGARAMTDAERQQRRRDRERQTRPEQERACRLRRSLLNTLGRWLDNNQDAKGASAVVIVDALHDLATLVTSLVGRTLKEQVALRQRYLSGESLDSLDDDDTLRRLSDLFGPEAVRAAQKKIARRD